MYIHIYIYMVNPPIYIYIWKLNMEYHPNKKVRQTWFYNKNECWAGSYDRDPDIACKCTGPIFLGDFLQALCRTN